MFMKTYHIISNLAFISFLFFLMACEKEKISESVMLTRDQPYLEVDINSRQLSFIAGGGTRTIEIKSNVDWYVDAPAWIVCSPEKGDANSGVLSITVDENPTKTKRSGTIQLKSEYADGLSISVTQDESIIIPNEEDNVLPKQR